MELRCGDKIFRIRFSHREGYLWIENLDGEGMEVGICKLVELIEDLWRREF